MSQPLQRAKVGTLFHTLKRNVDRERCRRKPSHEVAACIERIVVVILALAAFACGPQLVVAPQPKYTPKYTFQSAKPAQQKQDVAIAIINPILKGIVAGADGDDMLKALPSALTDLITAKGMTYRGPFEQLDTMTFPDKKGSDLALYPEIELEAWWQIANSRFENRGLINSTTVAVCDVTLSSKGRVSFVVIEPLSKETLWRKTVNVDAQETTVPNQSGEICRTQMQKGALPPEGRPLTAQAFANSRPSLDGDVGNAYRRMLEATFMSVMKGIDTYVNTEEFAALKHQSQELREKKVY